MNKHKAIALSFVSSIFGFSLLLYAAPALAHHPNGGNIPSTLVEGLMSGFGHPVVGIDHLVFVIAIGLLAALSNVYGMAIPTAFVVATGIGTAIHLQSIELPAAEFAIAVSVIVMGIFLAKEKQANPALLAIVGAIAGIFHGYAYGESIVGAETTALVAYLVGFCSIQLGISAIAFYLGRKIVTNPHNSSILLRLAGFTIGGIGLAFLSDRVLG